MGFLFQGPDLLVNGKTSEHSRDLEPLLPSHLEEFAAYLYGQLPGRLQYKGLGKVLLPHGLFTDWDGKGQCLARAGLGTGSDIPPIQGRRISFFLLNKL